MAIAIKKILDSLLTPKSDWRLTLLQRWDQLAGALHKQVRVEKIENDVLILGVRDVHWMQELYLLSRTICNQLNNALGDKYIRQIKFKLIETATAKAQHTHLPLKEVTYKEHMLTTAQAQALETVKDEELRKALRMFLTRALGKSHVAKKR